MIIRALVDYYESLAKQGKIVKPGWSVAKIAYALNISPQGELLGIFTLLKDEQRGKKTVKVPQNLVMPEGTKRSSGVAAQFLWDNAHYVLGIDEEGKEIRAKQCFFATREKTEQVLQNANGKIALALKAFFANWNPDTAKDNLILKPYIEELMGASNITFRIEGTYAHEDVEIIAAWNVYRTSQSGDKQAVCMVTGQKAPIARLHPNIKGVKGAQSSGAALVSFNAPSFESYGHEQGMNAAIGEYAAFAYTTALNMMLADRSHYSQIGDTTIVFWAEDDLEDNTDFFDELINDKIEIKQKDLQELFASINSGNSIRFNDKLLQPSNKFYILGLSPNAARVSVRFFLANTFGYFLQNITWFYQRLEIVKPSYDKKETLPLWQILQETANKNSKDKSATTLLAGSVMRSFLSGSELPVALFQNIILRVKADQDNPDKFISKVSRIKAAIIKAYLIRNEKRDVTVGLEFTRKNKAYILGRLFAVLEHLQESANPGINSTIKDRYFNAACATPGIIFPVLMRLARSHQKKLSAQKGMVISFEKDITHLLCAIDEMPNRLALVEQGEFILGYYHQLQYRYTKKEEK